VCAERLQLAVFNIDLTIANLFHDAVIAIHAAFAARMLGVWDGVPAAARRAGDGVTWVYECLHAYCFIPAKIVVRIEFAPGGRQELGWWLQLPESLTC
jgi:hypothetical protein